MGLYCTDPAQPLTTAGGELDGLHNDAYDLSDLSGLDHDLSVLSDLDHDLSDLSVRGVESFDSPRRGRSPSERSRRASVCRLERVTSVVKLSRRVEGMPWARPDQRSRTFTSCGRSSWGRGASPN